MPPPLKLRQRPETRIDPVLAAYKSFLSRSQRDEDGTSYIEQTVSATPSTWQKTNPKYPQGCERPIQRDSKDGDHRVCSLSYYARKVINNHVNTINPAVLRTTPWEFGKIIWEDAVHTGRDNLALWCTFTTSYPTKLQFLSPSRSCSNIPTSEPLQQTIAALSSLCFSGIIYLNLRRSNIYTTALLNIPSLLPNVHTILLPPSPDSTVITDTLLRTWACSGKLQRLSQLELRSCSLVTAHSLEYLSWLPELTHLDLTGCNLGSGSIWSLKARDGGWSCRKDAHIAGLDEVVKMVEKREPVLGISSGGFHPTPMRKNDMIFYRSAAKAREVAEKKGLEVKRAEKAAAMAELSKRNEEPRPKVPIRSKRKLDMVGILQEFAHAGPPRRKR